MRLDTWLWQARFFRTRTLATEMVRGGRVRIGGVPTRKAAAAVGAEDVLTVNFGGGHVRVVRILAPGTRRGPAEEARRLYEEIDAPSGMPGPGLRADPSGHS